MGRRLLLASTGALVLAPPAFAHLTLGNLRSQSAGGSSTAATGPAATGILLAGQPGPGLALVLPASDAGALIGAITVTTAGAPYAGVLTLGGTDAAKFALSNGGSYPCNLLVGASSIAAGTYNISLTATP